MDDILGDIKVRGTTSWPLPPQLPSFLIKGVHGEERKVRWWGRRQVLGGEIPEKQGCINNLPSPADTRSPDEQENRERRKMQR